MPTGLFHPSHLRAIVTSMRETEAEWAKYTVQFRKAKIAIAVFSHLKMLGILPPILTRDNASASLGKFNFCDWTLNVNPDGYGRAMDATELKEIRHQVSNFGSTIVHEARHCEQSFRMGRLRCDRLLAEGRKADARDLNSHLGIALHVAHAIVAAPPLRDPAEIAEAEQWYESVYGSGRSFRGFVLVRMQGCINGLGSLRQTDTPIGNAYQYTAYTRYVRDLPEEHDAHLVGRAVEVLYQLPFKTQPPPLRGHAPVQDGISDY